MDALLGVISHFLKSFEGVVASATTLVLALVALFAALKKLSPTFRSLNGKSKRRGQPTASRPSRISVGASACLVLVAGIGLGVGLVSRDWLWKRYPLQLTGSTNTYSYLVSHCPQCFTPDVSMTDQGSSQALQQAFQIFDYGKTVGNPSRIGWLALSSNGDSALREVIHRNRANEEFLSRNYWLSLVLTRRPLMIIYRDISSQDLEIERAATYPPEGSRETPKPSPEYSFVRATALKRYLLGAEALPNVRLYLPEQQTGTRDIFDASQRRAFQWPAARQLPMYIDEFATAGSMLSLVSEVPSSSAVKQRSNVCEELNERHLRVALVCADHDLCDDFPSGAFSIIAKIQPESANGSSLFRVTNEGECRFVRALSGIINDRCLVTGATDQDHILKIDAVASSPDQLPPAVTCK